MSKDTSKKGLGRVNTARKIWYKIVAPKLFGQMELGETYLASPDQAVGRKVKINLKDLTGNVKDQNAYVNFLVDGIEGTTLKASAVGYELTATHVKKLVRKNTNRLDDYFVLRSKDGKVLIAKTLMITQSKAQRSVQKQLRQTLKALLAEELKNTSFEMFIGNLVSRKVQITAKKTLHKIFPLNEVAIRVLSLKKNPTAQEGEMQQEATTTEEPTLEVAEEIADAEESPQAA